MKNSLLGVAGIAVLCAGCPKDEIRESGTCAGCHRPSDQVGIEVPHPLFAIDCADCHGGDPNAETVTSAHVARPVEENIRKLPLDQLRREELALYRRFVNPGDLIAAPQTCGAGGGSNCHQDKVDTQARSIHATAAGITNIPRFASGLRPANEHLSPVAVTHEEFDSGSAPDDALGSLRAIVLPSLAGASPAEPSLYLEHALSKSCSGCHLHVYGLVDYGSGRQGSTGCSTCHLVYAEDGRSQSSDPVIAHDERGHPARHVIERHPPQSTCEGCHFRSTRIGMQFRGIREQTLDDRRFGLASPEVIDEELHGRPPGFFIIDDDDRDNIDLTPPDVHAARGMICADCHRGQDMHGTGHIRASMGFETGIECSDCHGSFEADAGQDGVFVTSGGAPLDNLRRDGDRVLLRRLTDGAERPVTQLSELKVRLDTEALENAHSASNHGELECYACHTAWMQNVYGQRFTLDLRHESRDPITGEETTGVVIEENELVTLGNLQLGINADGKIGPFMAYNILFDVIAPCDPQVDPDCKSSPEEPIFGRKVVHRYVPPSADGKLGLTFTPVFPHTTATRATVQPCERCHPRQYEVTPGGTREDDSRVRATYGQGNGVFRIALTGGTSTEAVDLSRFADERSQPITGFSQPGVGPIPLQRVMRPLSFRVPPTLR